jgi:hypothetical protein
MLMHVVAHATVIVAAVVTVIAIVLSSMLLLLLAVVLEIQLIMGPIVVHVFKLPVVWVAV